MGKGCNERSHADIEAITRKRLNWSAQKSEKFESKEESISTSALKKDDDEAKKKSNEGGARVSIPNYVSQTFASLLVFVMAATMRGGFQ